MRERTDSELVALARRGEASATAELFSRYWRAARATAFGVTGDVTSAEDAASEGFRKALSKLDSLEDPARFAAWLRTIVIRQARAEIARRAKTVDASEAVEQQWADHRERVDQALERAELQALLQQAVHELPPRLREAVALVYFEGYEQAEASRFLGVPPASLRRRLHDARDRMREIVERIFRNGNSRMNQDRERELARLRALMDEGKTYEAMRGLMTMRPLPAGWMDSMFSKIRPPEEVMARMQSFLGQNRNASPESLDASHPLGATVAAIRAVLPEFQEWEMDPQAFMVPFRPDLDRMERYRISMPPGFAEGRPGNFLRRHRAPMIGETSLAENIFEVFGKNADEASAREAFTAMRERMRWVDGLVLNWMVAGDLELRSVQELLERLAEAVLPDVEIRFSPNTAPVYRAGLKMEASHAATPVLLASGGVAAPYEGGPVGVSMAHVRLFVEAWARFRP